MRIVQVGYGDPRPLILVYHLSERVDAALRAAAGPSAFIANETASGSTYNNIPSLAQTVAELSSTAGTRFAPVVVAGFSAGGFATRRILELGGDPDALVVADGTYATDPSGWAAWQAYADRAKRKEHTFIASNTSLIVPSSTWHVLRAISGFDLPLGATVTNRPAGVVVLPEPGPVRNEAGNFVIYSYPTEDKAGHEYQGDHVLPMMLDEALSRVSTPRKSLLPAVVVTLGLAAVGGLAYMLFLRHDKGATREFASQNPASLRPVFTLTINRLIVSRASLGRALRDLLASPTPVTLGPVDVWRLEDGTYLLVDGYHRLVRMLVVGQRATQVRLVGSGYTDYWATPLRDDKFVFTSTTYGGLEVLADTQILERLKVLVQA